MATGNEVNESEQILNVFGKQKTLLQESEVEDKKDQRTVSCMG